MQPFPAWLAAVAEWKSSKPLCYQCNGNIKPQSVIEALYDITGGDAIIATEVGQHQMWVAQFYSFTKPRTLLTSGGLGTMGYGFPASVGAQFAFPDKKVIAVAGDASLQMNIQELATVVANRLPIKVVILNNRYLGMVIKLKEFIGQAEEQTRLASEAASEAKLAQADALEAERKAKNKTTAMAAPASASLSVVCCELLSDCLICAASWVVAAFTTCATSCRLAAAARMHSSAASRMPGTHS